MFKLIFLISALFLACQSTKTQYSAVLHESATVVTTIYSPSRHEANLEYSMTSGKAGHIGVDFNGNIGIGLGNGMQISHNTVPEKFGAVFQCQHGIFTSEGSDARHKALYDKLKNGMNVDVLYKEIYTETYDDTNKDGKDEMIDRTMTGLDFLDANPK